MKRGGDFIVQGVKKLSPETAFGDLKKHLARATVTFDYGFKDYSEEEAKLREDEPTRIDNDEPFQSLMFNEVEAGDTAASELLLQEYAATFCRDGQRWVQNAEVSPHAQKKCIAAIEDWLVLRRASREESHILLLNKIGIERDEEQKRINVAKHCGLQMPTEYNKQ